MKKVMMILAVVCAVGMAKGAYVDWKYGKDTTKNGYTLYAFDNANSATVLAALGAYDSTAQATIDSLVLSTATVKKGNGGADGVDVGSATSLMIVGVDGSFADGVVYFYDTLDISTSVYTPPATSPGTVALASFSNSGTVAAAGGGGGTTDVPEPTSGLLMLIGIAGLALRRKAA